MTDFFLSRFADIHHFDIKAKLHADQRMVGVHHDTVFLNFHDGEDKHVAFRPACVVPGTDLDFLVAEPGLGDIDDLGLVTRTVGVLGGNRYREFFAGPLAFECSFQPGDEVAGAVEINQGLTSFPFRGIDDFSVIVF